MTGLDRSSVALSSALDSYQRSGNTRGLRGVLVGMRRAESTFTFAGHWLDSATSVEEGLAAARPLSRENFRQARLELAQATNDKQIAALLRQLQFNAPRVVAWEQLHSYVEKIVDARVERIDATRELPWHDKNVARQRARLEFLAGKSMCHLAIVADRRNMPALFPILRSALVMVD